ncbi:MAG: hypothetical protein ACLR2G_13600 [Phascolarctobacterium faecium]
MLFPLLSRAFIIKSGKLNDLLSDSDFSDYRFYLNNLLRLSKHVLPKSRKNCLLSQLATSGPAAISPPA